jgi:hypothetical protein
MSSKEKNTQMLNLAYQTGIKNSTFRSFINGFPKDFFLFLRQGLKSNDILFRTKAFKVSAEMMEELDDQVDRIAQKTGIEKGIVYFVLLETMDKGEEFSEIRNFCREHKIPYGNQTLEKLLSQTPEPKKAKKGPKKMHPKGKRV